MEAGRYPLWTGAVCSGAIRVACQRTYGSFFGSNRSLCNQRSGLTWRRGPREYERLTVRSNVSEGAKSSERDSSEDTQQSVSGTSPRQLETASSTISSPFASGKISSRIAAKKQDEAQQTAATSGAQKKPPKKPSAAVRVPLDGQLSDKVASQLKVARPPSAFNSPRPSTQVSPVDPSADARPATPPNPFRRAPMVPDDWEKAGARPAGSGKRVLDAFKEGKGSTTKFGQPQVPNDIFDEVRRTPEEIAADAFKFEISPGQLFLLLSFVVIIAVMLATALLVWKVGAIHYNEY